MTRRWRASMLFVVGTAAAAAMASCAAAAEAQPSGPDAVPRPSAVPEVHPAWVSCADQPPAADVEQTTREAVTLPLLDPAFQPVQAVVCGAGEPAEIRSSDISTLVAVLREPDEATPTAVDDDGILVACTAEVRHVPWLALVDAGGRWVRPALPRTACDVVAGPVLEQ
ncbi:MAG TPA: hypothetical protein VN408_35185, partial [Actinoplanes sp.]|nr:hypothetical protein [Actinoplanes sp.]